MNRSMAISALLGVAAAAAPCDADLVFGSVLSHNGAITSLPAGTGEVDVELVYGGITGGPHQAFYREVAVHEVHFSFPPVPGTQMINNSSFLNNSGVAWAGFRILLEGADFGGWDPDIVTQARSVNPVAELGIPPDMDNLELDEIAHQRHLPAEPEVSASAITRFNNQGSGFRDAELVLWFDAPSWILRLWYEIIPSAGVPNPTEFTGYFEPIPIPEPVTAAFLGLAGLVTLATRRRSFQAPIGV